MASDYQPRYLLRGIDCDGEEQALETDDRDEADGLLPIWLEDLECVSLRDNHAHV